MKKLFSKIETKIDNTAKETNNYIGKVFTIGRLTVTVEETLAEGSPIFLRVYVLCLKIFLQAVLPLYTW